MPIPPFIFHQAEKHPIHLPRDWRLVTFADFENVHEPADITQLIRGALQSPIQSPTLNELLACKAKIAVIVEDNTRPAPKKEILTMLLNQLQQVGIDPSNITIVIAQGTHSAMTRQAMADAFGPELIDRFTFLNHNCQAHNLKRAAALGNGFPVKINRHVYEADFRIGVGTIAPHPLSGFSGGGKILFPGVADFDSIREHHLRCAFKSGSILGNITDNPFHEEIVAAARIAKLDFIINAVVDHRDKTAAIVAGDPLEAHLEGIKISRRLLSCPFPKKADVTITTTFPYQHGAQFIKALAPAAQVTHEGGTILLAADIKSFPNLLVNNLAALHAAFKDRLTRKIDEYCGRGQLLVENAAIDYNMAVGYTLAMQDQFDIILISKPELRAEVRKMGFIHADNMADAIQYCQAGRHTASVHILPSGGILLPAAFSDSFSRASLKGAAK